MVYIKCEICGIIFNHKIKSGSNKLGYKGLLRYVYFTYPEYFKIIIKKWGGG